MNKQTMLDDLSRVSKEANKLDPLIAEQLEVMGKKLEKISEQDFEESNELEKMASEKQAKLLNPGDRVICVSAIAPIFKGRIYIVADNSMPGFIAIREESGEDVGIFELNRFSLDWKAF